MFKFQKEKCIRETTGVVIKKRWNGQVWFLTAEYTVDGKTYKKSEQLRYQKEKTYKMKNIPVGMRSRAPLGSLERRRFSSDKIQSAETEKSIYARQ